MVYWPFALPAEMLASAEGWLRTHLDLLGVGYQLDTWQSLGDHAPSELDTAQVDLLFVGGGNTFRLLDQVRRCGFVESVRRFWNSGGDYYGGSAGALLACDSIEIAEGHDHNEPGLRDLTALGLLPDVAVLPHFTDDQLGEATEWSASRDTVVIGLPESVGLWWREQTATVVGAGTLTRIRDGVGEHVASGTTFEIAPR
ncbi:Type 1 glutamine amidotransferase-like domain-containing protein [Microlunatus sp. Gsoil 973]|uniref:Type 1 glutamine amidotransferase-like domain-containing protein n=1 Tax=Microlunatus sp. Gsoil 973 TaxID=2672569 RepID=UPI0018A81689|nr:Type 1 glutamine amidotransferase-like domain-containing protein [Microlunatus sp. Gsoil 973]